MSPSIPPVLVLSCFLLVSPPHAAEAGELMDLLALIRGTLKYWRRVYHMYEEEVALGYCWAEHLLHLRGEEASSGPDLGPHHDFHDDFEVAGFGDGVGNEAWNGWIVGVDNGEAYRRGERSYGSRDEPFRILAEDRRGVYSKIDGNGNERVAGSDGKYRRGKRSYGATRKDEPFRILAEDRQGVFGSNGFRNDNENETWRGWIIGVNNGEGYRSSERSYGSLGILDRDVYSKIDETFGFGNERVVGNDGNYRRGKRSYDERRDESLKVLGKNRGVYSKIDENALENNFEDGFENGAWNEWIIAVDNGEDYRGGKGSYGTWRKDGTLGIFENRNSRKIVENEGRNNDRAVATNNNKRKYRGNKTSYEGRKEEEILESKDYNDVYSSKIAKEFTSGDSMSESVLNFGDKKVFDDVRGYENYETLNFTKEKDLLFELAKKHGSNMIVSMENGTEISSPNLKERDRFETRKNSSISIINSESPIASNNPAKRQLSEDNHPSSKKQQQTIEEISRTIPRTSVQKFPAFDHANRFEPNGIPRANLEQDENENPSSKYERSPRNLRVEKWYSSNGIPPSNSVFLHTEEISSRILGNDFASEEKRKAEEGGPVPTRRTSDVEETRRSKFRSSEVKNSGSRGEILGKFEREFSKVARREGRRLVERTTAGWKVWGDGVSRERREEEGQASSGVRRESGKVKVGRNFEGKMFLGVRFDSTKRGCGRGGFSAVPSSAEEKGESSRKRDASSVEVLELERTDANHVGGGSSNARPFSYPGWTRVIFSKPWKHESSKPDEGISSSSGKFDESNRKSSDLPRTKFTPAWRKYRGKRDTNDGTTRERIVSGGAASSPRNPASFREIRGSWKKRDDVSRTNSRGAALVGRHRGIRTVSLSNEPRVSPPATVYSRLKNSGKDGRRGGSKGEGAWGEEGLKQLSGHVRRDNWRYGEGGEKAIERGGKWRKKWRIEGSFPSTLVAYRFTEDYGGVGRWWRTVDQGRRSSREEARGLDRGDSALFHLRQAFMGFLRALGFFVNVGRQLMDYVESNGALACTKDYLVGKAIHWIDS